MKNVEVVAAVIRDKEKILITKRGYGEFKGLWEFPGGKIEFNETKEDALKREIKEELNVNIKVNSFISTINYDYENFHLIMHLYFAEIIDGNIVLNEHLNSKWINLTDINNYIKNNDNEIKFLEADIKALIEIQKYIGEGFK